MDQYESLHIALTLSGIFLMLGMLMLWAQTGRAVFAVQGFLMWMILLWTSIFSMLGLL